MIANPLAGSRGARWRMQDPGTVLTQLCERMNATCELHLTSGPGDATYTARQAGAKGFDVVVAAGGDGTINEVLNGLVGTKTEMGIIPLGTENVLAKERHIPLNLEKACHHVLSTKARAVDVGQIGDRYFLCFAGAGFDALVVEKVNPEVKARLGALAYVMTALDIGFKYQEVSRRLRMLVDGEPHEMDFWQVMIGNIQTYGGGLRVTPRASMHDGLLDLMVLPKTDIPGMIHQVVAAATGAHLNLPDVRYFQGHEFILDSDPPVQVQMDGELIGSTPLKVSVVPGALQARF